MANKRVSLVRKCKTPQGWKRYPALMSANGKVKTDAVTVRGVEMTYPIGHYELGSYVGSKRVWTRVSGNATDALAALKLAQKRANAVVIAGDAGVKVVSDPTRLALREAAPRFVQAALGRKSMEAAEIYQRTLEDFLATCSKVYADELTNDDVLKWHAKMRGAGLSDRTVHNRHASLRAFILSLGLDVKTIAGKAPRFEKTLPEIYEPAELEVFFASLTREYDQNFFDLLLTTGLREREAMHLEWIDIKHARSTLHVRSKPRFKHKIKDAEEREMPLTADLAERLKSYRGGHSEDRLVFGRLGGKVDEPDGHLLRRLKGLVRDAGLNCGSCKGCISKHRECEKWFLHKFRATYITTLLRNGLDLRTVMKLSGHSDLESVMRYLRPAEGAEVQQKVNAIKWR